ncbi:scarecrow-like protein 22 [Diospyros lotus]|uniref:scarecrow-like protein 22 n=1 Tax=Diospyros lotus TaxID=55363 RepID=UPI0022569DDE|nr:scarecrow-like protein 22 [Diospyros lotus]
MIGMQYKLQGGKGLLEVSAFGSVSSLESKWKKKEDVSASNEPISVLDTRSPSPSTSTSTLSSSLGGSAAAQKWLVSMPPEIGSVDVTESAGAGARKEEWAAELQQIPAGLEVSGGERPGFGPEDWEILLVEPGQDQSLLPWIGHEVFDASFGLKQAMNTNEIEAHFAPCLADQGSTANAMAGAASLSCSGGSKTTPTTPNSSSGMGNSKAANSELNPQTPIFGSSTEHPFPSGVIFQQQELEAPEEKPQIFNSHLLMNQQLVSQLSQNQNLFPPSTQQDSVNFLESHSKRQTQNLGVVDLHSQISKAPFLDIGQEFWFRKQQQPSPLGLPQQMQVVPSLHLQQQAIYEQLSKAVELILAGNFSHAQGILARLNHQLSPVATKPFQRAAFYFKEALQLPLLIPNLLSSQSLPPRTPTPLDGFFKMGAYKLLSEVSPLIQFMNFTSNQALLEALGDAQRVHVIDFDVGFGAQWASFMQELPGRSNRGTPSLKITAFASPSTHHHLELGLMHENLTQFATESGINFELEVVNFDAFDPNSYQMPPLQSPDKEAIAVNFPIWACSSRPSVLPALLRFIKQLSPNIVVSLGRGCERTDLPFSHHVMHALQYYEALLDSIGAANATSEAMSKIERFLIQPRIESMLLGRLNCPEHIPHWKSLFASAGFSPVALSNFTEAQAECVLKGSQVRGFHVEKRQGSLILYWQGQELVSASAWRC